MNVVKIDEAKVIEAAKAGNDEFVDVFYNAILDFCGGVITAETMQEINPEQMTLVVFKTLHEEVMDGGFVQLRSSTNLMTSLLRTRSIGLERLLITSMSTSTSLRK